MNTVADFDGSHYAHVAPWLLLVIAAALPWLVMLMLRLVPQRQSVMMRTQLGNPLLDRPLDQSGASPMLKPIAHLVRDAANTSSLGGTALWLQSIPIEQSEPILRCLMNVDHPEVQLYSESLLRAGRVGLQGAFLRLKKVASTGDPAAQASFVETALRLSRSRFTEHSERESIIKELLPVLQATLEGDQSHPRLLFELGRFSLALRRLEDASVLFQRLPLQSPLWQMGIQMLEYHRAIASPHAEANG